MSEYLADGRAITEVEFTVRACDPRASAVVEACAGSGKTWLLVGRIVRALLAGAAPGEILAITFTRRAAQEMRARLMHDLRHLASADETQIVQFLVHRGIDAAAARQAVGDARALYERVAAAHVAPTIETFHGWFWQLVSRAPLGAGVPFSPALLESTDRLRSDAWLHFSAALLRDSSATQRAAWESLIDAVGDVAARRLVEQLLYRRAEWWSFSAGDEDAAVERALEPLRGAGETDPAAALRDDDVLAAARTLLAVLRSIAKPNPTTLRFIEALHAWLASVNASAGADLRALCSILLTKELTPRDLLTPEKIRRHLATDVLFERYAGAHALLTARLDRVLADRRVWRAYLVNRAAFACGRLLIAQYQRLKAQQQALDFTDLEWHAYRLLADEDNAAYMQARLDARYRHILLDEFQDTNPLQWQILRGWLAAYGEMENGAQGDRPSVFVVGDPKQSIYRFRRAEPRVFDAALELLRRDFGAAHLRTNVTRRNASRIVDALNLVMPAANPLYQAQSTRAAAAGEFVVLPLVPPPEPADAAASADPPPLRDVLTTARDERDSDTRYREGRIVANEMVHALTHVRVTERDGERAARWSDVLLLVRRRTHLADYERALRDAGVPFVSDRRGGLLATLESEDLGALLGFLTAPFNDLQLAHALRSPIFGCTDDDLIRIASTGGASWWQRLQTVAATPADAPSALARAHGLLARWLDVAGALPVHDLLDRIYFEGDVRRRYAAVVPASMLAQVQANLDAFIELALAIDAGRYPSLPRFIDELAGLKQHAADEAPDEGVADSGDAARVMTIHGAKGLEAEIVVLADAHSVARPEGESALVVWPPHAAAPEHLSLVARGAEALDAARADWFAQEDAQRAQEDWNLLYVAATRARQVLIVSGSSPARGTPQDSWYARLMAAQALSAGAAEAQVRPPSIATRRVHDFLPAPLPTGSRTAPAADSEAQRLGRAWHALLESGEDADLDAIARAYAVTNVQMEMAINAARRVRRELPQLFDAGGQAELELVSAGGELLRVDRLVEKGDALWIVDFKWRITESERAAYVAQVQRYGAVLREIRRDKPVRLGLVSAEGELIDVTDD